MYSVSVEKCIFKFSKLIQSSWFALAELRMAYATIFRRFELEPYETVKDSDVDFIADCPWQNGVDKSDQGTIASTFPYRGRFGCGKETQRSIL